MKSALFTLILSVLVFRGFCQDELQFEVRGTNSRSVTQEALVNAKTISDFVSGYPVNWITSYASVEISATHQGRTLKATGINDVLSAGQISILKNAEVGDIIIVDAKYKYKGGTMYDDNEDSRIYITMTVVPDKEAEFVGGKQLLSKYLRENAINKIQVKKPLKNMQAILKFTVDESGEIVNTVVSQSTGDIKTDQLLVEEIKKMPKWKPAQNSKGVKVKQEFEFSLGSGGC